MPKYPGFVGPANPSQSYMAEYARLVNWYVENGALMPCPGFNLFASVTPAPIRGCFAQRDRAFFVAGFALYELFANGTTIQRGTVLADTNPVTFDANGDAGNQLWITSGGVGYIYDLTSDTLTVEGVPATIVSMGGFLSGRFLYLDATTGAFYASAIYDGTTWDASMIAQSESGDPWRALIVTPDGLIRLLGETTSEAWADQGASPFPFSKIQEATIPYGIVAPFAWGVDTALTWVAQNKQGRGIIVRSAGYQPTKLSSVAIDTTIQGYGTLSDTLVLSYQQRGQSVTMLSFPTGGQTWAVNQEGLLHELASWDATSGSFQPSRIGCVLPAFNRLFVGDRLKGHIYEMGPQFSTDIGGGIIRRVRQPPRLSVDQRRFVTHSLEVVMDTGQGLVTGQGSDPQLMLETSVDGGKIFGNERWASTGRIGEFGTRVNWTRCGQARNRVDRFVATDPVPWRLVDCVIDYTVGMN